MAEPQKLSPELVSLVHHIELNKAGWWDLAVGRLVLTALWLEKDIKIALNAEEVRQAVKSHFEIDLGNTLVAKHLKLAEASGKVLELSQGNFKLSEDAIADCGKQLNEAIELESDVKRRFQSLLEECCPLTDPETAWLVFSDKFLVPTVRELGANTYRLISGDAKSLELPKVQAFTNSFPEEDSASLRSFVRAFLDPTDSVVRRYVLKAMNAYFVVRASGLDERTVHLLAESATKQWVMTLFFDTNVLFSLLGLHENPADEGSRALLSLVRSLSSSVPIKLRVLLPTVDEMKRAITASQEAVLNMRISPNLLGIAAGVGISGITEKFLRLAASRETRVVPADYFQPYLKNLLTVLDGSGVQLFNHDLSAYATRQDVIDDLLEQKKIEDRRYGVRAKNYERLEHDIVIWHFVKDKRPLRPESPAEAGYWFVTADYRLLGFDSLKQQVESSEMPICIHPITLTQLLQFWVPQTPEFEKALLSAMRLPSVLTTTDGDAERISLKILNALSAFENIGDLPTETTTRVLLNDALRQKLSVEDDVAKQVELVREVLIEENKKAEQRLNEERARSGTLLQDSEKLRAELSRTISDVHLLKGDLEIQRVDAETSKREAQETQRKLSQYIAEAESRSARTNFALISLSAALVSCLGTAAVLWLLGYRTRAEVCGLAIVIMCWLFAVDRIGRSMPVIAVWKQYETLMHIRRWVYGSLITGAMGSALWDGIKELSQH